jgi:hypothetical protein
VTLSQLGSRRSALPRPERRRRPYPGGVAAHHLRAACCSSGAFAPDGTASTRPAMRAGRRTCAQREGRTRTRQRRAGCRSPPSAGANLPGLDAGNGRSSLTSRPRPGGRPGRAAGDLATGRVLRRGAGPAVEHPEQHHLLRRARPARHGIPVPQRHARADAARPGPVLRRPAGVQRHRPGMSRWHPVRPPRVPGRPVCHVAGRAVGRRGCRGPAAGDRAGRRRAGHRHDRLDQTCTSPAAPPRPPSRRRPAKTRNWSGGASRSSR